MKLYFIFFSLALSMASFAQATKINECSSKSLGIDNWSALPEEVRTCLDASSDFVEGMSYLCSEQRTQVSVIFGSYLKYKKSYEDAVSVLQAIPVNESRAVAQMKVQWAAEDWVTLGNRHQVSTILNKVHASVFHCR